MNTIIFKNLEHFKTHLKTNKCVMLKLLHLFIKTCKSHLIAFVLLVIIFLILKLYTANINNSYVIKSSIYIYKKVHNKQIL